jgi:hypothetical protein
MNVSIASGRASRRVRLCTPEPGESYAWYSIKYVDTATFRAGEYRYTALFEWREFNKLWRPVGSEFYLVYYYSTGYGTFIFDTWNNPVIDNRNALYAQAECGNFSGNSVSPVTCLTTTP